MRPIFATPSPSGNQSAPSGRVAMPIGPLAGMGPGVEDSVTAPGGVMRPILLAESVNQSAPSGPATMPPGLLAGLGMGYSVIAPAVGMRPILLRTTSVNHNAPSGPAVMSPAPHGQYAVITPAIVIR